MPNSLNTQFCCQNTGCALNNCLCDEELAYQLGYNLIDQINFDYVTHEDGSGFDHISQCSASSNGAGLDESGEVIGMPTGLSFWTLKCCGVYPHRFSYKTDRNSCCANSFLTSLGEC